MKFKSGLYIGQPQEFYHALESAVKTLPEICQAGCCDHCPGEPIPVPDDPPGEETFPNIQPKRPLTEFHAVPSDPVTDYQRKDRSTPPSLCNVCPPLGSQRNSDPTGVAHALVPPTPTSTMKVFLLKMPIWCFISL